MSQRTAEIVYGLTGQTVEMYPPEALEGVSSSMSASVFRGDRSNDDTAEFSPTVTQDSVATTLSAAAGYSQATRNTISLASTTGVVAGRQYRLANLVGQREIVTLSNTTTLQEDLAYDYPISSTFKGIRMVFTVDPTWVATEEKISTAEDPHYRVLWTYTVNSIVRKHYTYLRLVRQLSKHGVTITDLLKWWPDLQNHETRERKGQQFSYAIDAAWDRVRLDLISCDVSPDRVREQEILSELVISKTLHVLSRVGITPGQRDRESWVRECESDYSNLLAAFIKGPLRMYIDQGQEGNAEITPVRPLAFQR